MVQTQTHPIQAVMSEERWSQSLWLESAHLGKHLRCKREDYTCISKTSVKKRHGGTGLGLSSVFFLAFKIFFLT